MKESRPSSRDTRKEVSNAGEPLPSGSSPGIYIDHSQHVLHSEAPVAAARPAHGVRRDVQPGNEDGASTLGNEEALRTSAEHQYPVLSLDLKQGPYSSLEDAFLAALQAVRCLREALRVRESDIAKEDKEERVLFLLEQQSHFVDDSSAYLPLLEKRKRSCSCTLSGSSENPVGKSCPDTSFSACSDDNVGKEPSAKQESLHLSANHTAHKVGAVGEASECPQSVAVNAEYELSVCRALLLLKELNMKTGGCGGSNSSPDGEDSPKYFKVERREKPMGPLHGILNGRTQQCCSRTGGRRDISFLLDLLLKVRLLQGSEQLLRADVLELLQQQQEQQRQLEQQIRSTVKQLGKAKRESLRSEIRMCCSAIQFGMHLLWCLCRAGKGCSSRTHPETSFSS